LRRKKLTREIDKKNTKEENSMEKSKRRFKVNSKRKMRPMQRKIRLWEK